MQRTYTIMKVAAVLLIASLLVVIYYNNSNRQAAPTVSGDRTKIPSQLGPVTARPPAPDVLLHLADASGALSFERLSKFKGKVVHINFWAEWCEPCKGELPLMVEKQKHFGDDYKIILLNLDADTESRGRARDLARRLAPTLTLGFDEVHEIENIFKVEALPTHALIDRAGRVATIFANSIVGHPQFDQLIEALLNEKN